jgi:hypothetical protein
MSSCFHIRPVVATVVATGTVPFTCSLVPYTTRSGTYMTFSSLFLHTCRSTCLGLGFIDVVVHMKHLHMVSMFLPYLPSKSMECSQILNANIFPCSVLAVQSTLRTFQSLASNSSLYRHCPQYLPAHYRKLLGTTCVPNARMNKQGKFLLCTFHHVVELVMSCWPLLCSL